MPVTSHGSPQLLDLNRVQTRTALQGLVLAVVGVHGLHGLLVPLQGLQLGFQLLDSLRVVGADAAFACAADFVQDSLDLPPLRHGRVVRPVLLFFFTNREIASSGHQNGRNAGGDGVLLIDVLRQFAGVYVQQTVNPLMVNGVHLSLLLLRDPGGGIHGPPVFRCGAALFIIVEAVHFLGPAGLLLVDDVVVDSCTPPLQNLLTAFTVDFRISTMKCNGVGV